MTNEEQKLREIVERWMGKKHPITMRSYVSDLTALISEHYYPKEKYDELLQQRDKLKEALLEAVKTIRIWHGFMEAHPTEMKAWEYYQQSPEMKKINAAIKNAETK